VVIGMYRCTGCGRTTPVSGGPERKCERKMYTHGLPCGGVMLTTEEFEAVEAAARIGGREAMMAMLDTFWRQYGRVPLSQRSIALSSHEIRDLATKD
jgi:hypothetical protein